MRGMSSDRWRGIALAAVVLAGAAVMSAGAQEQEADNGWVSLFNGEDLSGWVGDTEGYAVEDEALVCRAGTSGNLLTQRQYADFVLRFEFRLTEGANNGLAIRSPNQQGSVASEGMELQIIDNHAAKWADLEDWQYHGSLYGIAAAKRGHLRPAGRWNEQEVRAEGRRVTVKLNGHVILDVDIDEALAGGTPDGREHPGALRERGHIGFLGHGDRMAFRKIRVRELGGASDQ